MGGWIKWKRPTHDPQCVWVGIHVWQNGRLNWAYVLWDSGCCWWWLLLCPQTSLSFCWWRSRAKRVAAGCWQDDAANCYCWSGRCADAAKHLAASWASTIAFRCPLGRRVGGLWRRMMSDRWSAEEHRSRRNLVTFDCRLVHRWARLFGRWALVSDLQARNTKIRFKKWNNFNKIAPLVSSINLCSFTCRASFSSTSISSRAFFSYAWFSILSKPATLSVTTRCALSRSSLACSSSRVYVLRRSRSSVIAVVFCSSFV